MGASNSNCIRQNHINKSINGDQNVDVPRKASPENTTSRAKMEEKADYSHDAGVVAPTTTTTTDDEPSKRRHSTPTCGIAHLSTLGADSPGEYDVRCRRSGSAAPRRVNRLTKDDSRRTALPPWAKAVRSSRGESSTAAQQRSGSGAGAMAELGHDGIRLESTTNDPHSSAAFVGRRQEFLLANYSMDERLDQFDSMGSSGRSSGVRYEPQIIGDTGDLIPPPQHPSAGQTRPSQQRRSSIAFLPISQGSTSSSLFSPRSMGPPTAAKDRINLGFGNASDLVASLIGSRGPDPAAGTTEDHFWVPPTILQKKRAQSLVPQKPSTDTRVLSGKSIIATFYVINQSNRSIKTDLYSAMSRKRIRRWC